MEFIGQIQRNGTIVIPKSIRDYYHLDKGTVVKLNLVIDNPLKQEVKRVGRPPKYDRTLCSCGHEKWLHEKSGCCGYAGCDCNGFKP